MAILKESHVLRNYFPYPIISEEVREWAQIFDIRSNTEAITLPRNLYKTNQLRSHKH